MAELPSQSLDVKRTDERLMLKASGM